MVVITCEKCGRDLANGLCNGCHNAPNHCTCEEWIEEETGTEEVA